MRVPKFRVFDTLHVIAVTGVKILLGFVDHLSNTNRGYLGLKVQTVHPAMQLNILKGLQKHGAVLWLLLCGFIRCVAEARLPSFGLAPAMPTSPVHVAPFRHHTPTSNNIPFRGVVVLQPFSATFPGPFNLRALNQTHSNRRPKHLPETYPQPLHNAQ